MSDFVLGPVEPFEEGEVLEFIMPGGASQLVVPTEATAMKTGEGHGDNLTPEDVAESLEDLEMTSASQSSSQQDQRQTAAAGGTSKKPGKDKGAAKKKEESNEKAFSRDRMHTFQRRTNTVKKTLKELCEQTNARSVLKISYDGPRSVMEMNISFPENLDEPETHGQSDSAGSEEVAGSSQIQPGIGSAQDVRKAVTEGVLDAYKQIQPNVQLHLSDVTSQSDDTDTDASMASLDSQGMRQRRTRRAIDPSACAICKRSGPTIHFATRAVESAVVKGADAGCLGQVHYYCLGLPQMRKENQLEGKWHCAIHVVVAQARLVDEVLPPPETHVAEASLPVASTSGASAMFVAPGQAKKRGRPAKAATPKPAAASAKGKGGDKGK